MPDAVGLRMEMAAARIVIIVKAVYLVSMRCYYSKSSLTSEYTVLLL